MEFIYSKLWCDVIFANRNCNYGAYRLRIHNNDYIIYSWLTAILIIGILLFIIAYAGGPSKQLIEQYNKKNNAEHLQFQVEKVLWESDHRVRKTNVAKSSKNPGGPLESKQKNSVIETIKAKTHIVSGTTNETLQINHESIKSVGGDSGIVNIVKDYKDDPTLLIPEVFPEFPGGESELIRFIQTNIKYPQPLLNAGISGTVYLSFLVDQSGMIQSIKVLKGVENGELLSEEAIRVLKKSPLWKPGLQGGKPVSVAYSLPITFIAK
jgi:protein TonB